MARDLYGEMLSRALNRGAPPGHSAAYITPQEGLQLRASGGGVPPGGGQYMANGIPSYWGPGEGSGVGSAAAGDASDSDGGQMGFGVDAAQAAQAEAQAAAQSAYGGALGGGDVMGVGAVQAASQAAAGITDPQEAYQAGLVAAAEYASGRRGAASGKSPKTPPAIQIPPERWNPTLRNMLTNVPGMRDKDGKATAEAVEQAQKNQSEDGLGWQSPGAMAITVGMDFDDLDAINSFGPEGVGYSVNSQNPDGHDIAVSFLNARYNPGFANTVFAAGSLVSPSFIMGVNMLNRSSPYAQYEGYQEPGFGNLVGQALRGVGLSGVVDAFGNVRDKIGDVISGVTDPITEVIGGVRTDIGREISEGFQPIGDFLSRQDPRDPTPSIPQDGGPDLVEAPVVPEGADAEEPFVTPQVPANQYAGLPPDIVRRLQATALYGEERVRRALA